MVSFHRPCNIEVVALDFYLTSDGCAEICFSITDWFFFLVLDIGNPVIEAIPAGVRVLDGALMSVAVRAAGFAIVPLAALAPAVK